MNSVTAARRQAVFGAILEAGYHTICASTSTFEMGLMMMIQ